MAETCVYAGAGYSVGSVICHAGRRKLCDANGQWSDLGTCAQGEPLDPGSDGFRIEFPSALVSSLSPEALRDFVDGVLLESVVVGLAAARQTAVRTRTFDATNRILADDGPARTPRPVGGGSGGGTATGRGGSVTTVKFGVEFPVGPNAVVTIEAQGQAAGGGGAVTDIGVRIRIQPK